MDKIIEFLKTLYEEHFYLILAVVVAFALLVFLVIVLTIKKQKAKKQKAKETFIKESVQALTPEEIEKISNNSSDPNYAKQTLIAEVVDAQESEEVTAKKPRAKKEKVVNEPVLEEPTTEEVAEVKKPRAKKVKKQPEIIEEVISPEVIVNANTELAQEPINTEVAQEPIAKKPRAKKVKQEQPVVSEVPQEQEVQPEKKVYAGKWKIKDDENGFYACLTASNGVLVLQTEYYKSLSGVKNGIETIKKNIEAGNFTISADKYGHYRYKLLSQTNKPLCFSEDYSTKAKCESGIESVKRFAKSAIVIREEK